MYNYYYYSVITVSEQEFNGKAGDIITCMATGYPEPNIVWLNDNGSVVNKSRPVNDSAASVILTVRRSDAGNYRCFANNFVGNDTTIINIKTVQCKLLSNYFMEICLYVIIMCT